MSETGETPQHSAPQNPEERYGKRAIDSVRRFFTGIRNLGQTPEQQERNLKRQLYEARALAVVKSLEQDNRAREQARIARKQEFDTEAVAMVQRLKEEDNQKKQARIEQTREQLQQLQNKNRV